MIDIIQAQVNEVLHRGENITKFNILQEGNLFNCINYDQLTGKIEKNDIVLLNTTAVELGLGSGGYHFVIANLGRERYSNIGNGHIMKLRYTPFQVNCMVAEEQKSDFHDVFNSFESLRGLPVIIGSLHSMIAPVALTLKKLGGKERIIYIMTDGGALPIWMSDTVARLSAERVLSRTITYGNAFGGDLECINIYTALIAAKEIYNADAIIVCMGPGIAGTDTKYGFSGIEQSNIVDAVNNLEGKAIAVPRISFSDNRSRHYGLSHHTITALGKLCLTKAYIAIPEFEEPKAGIIKKQLEQGGIIFKHEVSYWNTGTIEKLLEKEEDHFEKMGRHFSEEREYFITCGLSAMLAFN